MILLRPGDRVQVPEGGEVTLIFLGNGERERLKPSTSVVVDAKGCQPAEAVERLKGPMLPSANLDSLRDQLRSARGAVGVPRGDLPASPQVVTPMYGATILTDRPTLTWRDVKVDAYLVQLFSGTKGKDKRQLWKRVVKETRLSYPEKEMSLKFGNLYVWTVTALKGEEAAGEPTVDSSFLVLPKAGIALLANLKPFLESKSAADLLVAAASYEALGVYDEALRLYELLAAMVPDEANFQVALAQYYERAGRKDLAKTARERAKKLGAEIGPQADNRGL